MHLKFTKMQGVGNDFVVLDAIGQQITLDAAKVRRLADRHFGIGCDQILVVEAPRSPDTDFYYRIFNADGGEVSQCGNGARCFVRYVRDKGLTGKREIRVETASGVVVPRMEPDGQVTVDMGAPEFEPSKIPFIADKTGAHVYRSKWPTNRWRSARCPWATRTRCNWSTMSMTAPVLMQGPMIEHHARFPERVNAGYMEILDRHHVRLRVYERGAGETLACGTGACAAAVAGIIRGRLDTPVRVTTHGGDLSIAWAGRTHPVMMTGPAETVFEGDIDI